LGERIRRTARELGFASVGFARAEPHPDGARVAEWVESGRHGTMAWMGLEPERRGDPESILPGARTVISVAAGYYPGDWPAPPGPPNAAGGAPPSGKIARYAWGADYHKRMKRKLVRLGSALRALSPGARWSTAMDTRPFLDRAWAQRAGLGWVGKNTNLIRKTEGSWFFLGAIVTDVEIPPDPPATNYCGTCSRCMTACPTGAITGPYQIDARRCISYLTIEHRGAIPLELRPLIGTRIFGCDDCQEVCPWNRFAVKSADPAFAARPNQQVPELIPLLALDDAAFRQRFQGTALRRAGRNRFVRNVAVALGNAADPAAVPALERSATSDPDPVVRDHAAWALSQIQKIRVFSEEAPVAAEQPSGGTLP
jgi:epoxyqueuosine reductase